MSGNKGNQWFFPGFSFPFFYLNNNLPLQTYQFYAQQNQTKIEEQIYKNQNQIESERMFLKQQLQNSVKKVKKEATSINSSQKIEQINQNLVSQDQQSSQYKPNGIKTAKGFRQRPSVQYRKKNTQSNIINQIISFISDSYRSRKIIQSYFQLTPKAFQIFYLVTKKLKKQYDNYLTSIDLISLAVLDATHKGYKLLTQPLPKYKRTQYKAYCQYLPIDTFREILKFIFVIPVFQPAGKSIDRLFSSIQKEKDRYNSLFLPIRCFIYQ